MMELSPRSQRKAQEELREDEGRKKQSLVQFRDWIGKHPYIRNARQDDTFLLQFLRTKKYSMDATFKLFERYFKFRKTHPEWCEFTDAKLDRVKDMIKCGFGFPLPQRDDKGRTIMYYNQIRYNFDKHRTDDVYAGFFMMLSACLENEAAQVNGFVGIFDYTEVSLKYITSFTIKQTTDLIEMMLNAAPARSKEIYIVNLPSFANHLLNLAKMAMSEKMKKRLHILRSMDEIKNHFDVKLLPKEIGGVVPEAEMIEKALKNLDDHYEKLKESDKYEIDLDKAVAAETAEREAASGVGSFRKLEID